MININVKPIFLLLLSIINLSLFVSAVTISPGSPTLLTFDFEPGQKVPLTFTVGGAEYIDVYLTEEDLVGCLKLIDPAPKTGGRSVQVILTMPESMEKPGPNKGYITAKQYNPNPNGISTLASIRAPITVKVPYPGYYAELDFAAENINEDETEDFRLTVKNLGTNNLERVYATIEVYDESGKLKSLTTETRQMLSNTETTFEQPMSTSGMKPGEYRAVATLYYDGGNTIVKETTFNIGTLQILIDGYTEEIPQGGIRPVEVNIESKWNNNIENVYAMLLFEGSEVKTPSYTIGPLEKKTLTGYIDTSNQPFGEHDLKITVYYEDKTTIEDGKIKIVEPIPEESPEVQEPSGEIIIKINLTTILISIIVLLVVIDLAWVLLKNRRQEKPAERRKR